MELSERRERLCRSLETRGHDRGVVQLMRRVARHEFVPSHLLEQAYEDKPLPIGLGQTISQPTIIAIMTGALAIHSGERVLEVGTGSGYQTALLAELAGEVWTVERLPELSLGAQQTLTELGYRNIRFKVGDGSLGWKEGSPFGAILVTAASPAVPDPLKDQLAEGGRLVIPVGSDGEQELLLLLRRGDAFDQRCICRCSFVKLIGEQGYRANEN